MDFNKSNRGSFGGSMFILFAIGVVALILITVAAALIDNSKAEGQIYIRPKTTQGITPSTATDSYPPQTRTMPPRQPNRLAYMIEFFSPFSLTWYDLLYYDWWSFDPDPWEWEYGVGRNIDIRRY